MIDDSESSKFKKIRKIFADMMNGGFGESHVNSLLAVLNIVSISKRGLRKEK